MNVERRDDLRTWFAEVGYLYLLVALLIVVVFLVKDLHHTTVSVDSPVSGAVTQMPYDRE